MKPMNKTYATVFKVAMVLAPVVMGLLGYAYGDVTPVVYDVCQSLLPNGSINRIGVSVKEVDINEADAGAPR